MLETMTRHGWTLVFRGVAAVLFGVLLFASPALTLGSLILFFGAFALVDGVFNTVGSLFSVGKYEGWWLSLLGGLVGVAAGLVVLSWPGLTALTVLWFIAFWAITTGALQIVAAVWLRKVIRGEWFMGLGGALSTLFGLVLVLWPGTGILSLLWLTGFYAVAFGVIMTVLGVRVLRTGRVSRGFERAGSARG